MNLDFFTADVGGCTLMDADEFGFFLPQMSADVR
jgi:hypothetical protein